ncbi:class I SAM-dependent methyltransferase [Aureimonas mangrovi]|uniref:class I SAM-dependent methyltransferase n=1 Tax=Aureimonas mangrovi TaxID=2758041 RepID=UPI001FE9E0E2|nr:phospholipid methyltransferase [Aureimonas mangrovi]
MPLGTRLKRRACGEPSSQARFVRNWLRNPLTTGAVFPSSRALGSTMARQVPLGDEGVVVELGPGTGVVTQCLLDHGVPASRLLLLEYSQEFCAMLASRFPGVAVLRGDAYQPGEAFRQALGGRPIAAVVSSLPLMARGEADREAALSHHLSAMPAGAPFIQFTYSPTLPVRPERISADVETLPWVLLNLPPARVLVYRRAATEVRE